MPREATVTPCRHLRLSWAPTRYRTVSGAGLEPYEGPPYVVRCDDCGYAWQEHLAARRGLVPEGGRP